MSEEKKPRHYKFKEVCVRLEEGKTLYSDQMMTTPSRAADVMRNELSRMDREMLCVVNMNTKLNPINFNVVSIGTIDSTLADVPNIFKSAILSNSASIILMHNHPSGSCAPSEDDINMTNRLIAAGQLMNIRVLDHIIVGGQTGETFSMRNHNVVDFEMPFDLKEVKKLLYADASAKEDKDSVIGALKGSSGKGRSTTKKKVSEAER